MRPSATTGEDQPAPGRATFHLMPRPFLSSQLVGRPWWPAELLPVGPRKRGQSSAAAALAIKAAMRTSDFMEAPFTIRLSRGVERKDGRKLRGIFAEAGVAACLPRNRDGTGGRRWWGVR